MGMSNMRLIFSNEPQQSLLRKIPHWCYRHISCLINTSTGLAVITAGGPYTTRSHRNTQKPHSGNPRIQPIAWVLLTSLKDISSQATVVPSVSNFRSLGKQAYTFYFLLMKPLGKSPFSHLTVLSPPFQFILTNITFGDEQFQMFITCCVW